MYDFLEREREREIFVEYFNVKNKFTLSAKVKYFVKIIGSVYKLQPLKRD